jgi:hypothetical protein
MLAFGFEAPPAAPRGSCLEPSHGSECWFRWPRLGCATTVRPGLASVSALSTSPVADDSVHDVIARGSSVVVLVNYGSMAKVQVPPSVRAALEVLGAPPR